MKKSTRILTVLLAACLLFGICSAFVTSAAETNVLNVTNHSYNITDECTSGPGGTEYLASSTGNSLYFGYENSVKSKHINLTHVKDNSGENSYIRVHYPAGTQSLTTADNSYYREASLRWRGYTSYNSSADLKHHSYMTLDFDLAADRFAYEYTIDGVTGYKTAASDEEFTAYIKTLIADPEKVEECVSTAKKDLAFPADESLRMNMVYQSSLTDSANGQALSTSSSSSSHWKQVQGPSFFVFKLDDGWYIGSTKDSAEGAARLTNEVAMFDHITLVAKILDGGQKVETNLFLNGKFVSKLATVSMAQDSKYNIFYHLNIPFYTNNSSLGVPGDKLFDKYSFAYDNVALNYYTKEDLDVAGGLGDFMSGDYTEGTLMDCTNVVYNGEFAIANAPVLAEITHADGEVVKYYTPNSVLRSIRDGDFVLMHTDVKNYNPNPDEIRQVTFIAKEGTEAKVNLSDEATEYFKIQNTRDRYTVCYGSENDITIKWFDSEGIGKNLVKEHKIFPMLKPANNLKISGEIDFSQQKPTIGLLDEWLWDKDCDGYGDEPASVILDKPYYTAAELNETFREAGITEIHMVPKYDTKTIAYTITTDAERTELYVPDYDFHKFTDASTLANAIARLAPGKTYYVTLYSNCEVETEKSIYVPKNTTLDFDLNGYELSQVSVDSSVFTLYDNVTLNLYSSKEGGKVYQSGESAKAIITASNIDSSVINLSKVTENDAKGDNLTVYGASVLYLQGSAADVSNEKNIVVNINGGNYYGTDSANGALFMISEVDMIFNINSADMITVNGEAIFSVDDAFATSAEINVNDSKLFAGELDGDYTIGSFIANWASSAKAYIKNSVVLGFKEEMNVTVGSGNKFNTKTNAGIAYDSVTLAASSNNEAYVLNETIAAPGFESITADIEINLVTFTADAVPENVTTLEWLALDDVAFKTTYWVVGSIVDTFESTESFEGKDLDNKWYDIDYSGWNNVTTGEPTKNYTIADGVNKFAPAEKYVADFKSSKVSLTVFDGLAYNLYVPTPNVDGATVEFIGFFSGKDLITQNVYSDVTVDGISGWNHLIGLFANDEFSAKIVTVKYSVNGQVLEVNVKIDVFNYAYKIDSAYGCGSDESKLVYAMMQYKYNAFVETWPDDDVMDEVDAEMKKYYSFHGTDCKCGEVEYTAPEEDTANDSAISALVLKYSFALVLDESNNYASNYTFTLFLREKTTVKVNNVEVEGSASDGVFRYTVKGISLADIADDISITIGSESGRYNLAKYIEATNSDFAKALYVLSTNAKQQNA